MIDYLINGIAEAINKEFESARIYTEELKQGFKEPCFFIRNIARSHELFLGKRYFRRNDFCVSYFPEESLASRGECHSVAEKLMLCLEHILSNGEPVRGNSIHYEIEDGVLHFFVSYNGFLYVLPPREEIDLMQDLTVYYSIKKDKN